jgi:hypothetical protein
MRSHSGFISTNIKKQLLKRRMEKNLGILLLGFLLFAHWAPAQTPSREESLETLPPGEGQKTIAAVPGPRLPVPPPPASFRHPGLLNSLGELEMIRAKIEAGEQPWKDAFEQMKKSNYADLKYKPSPVEVSSSGILGRGGDAGGSKAESKDSKAAYTMALMWVFTRDERYAEKAVEIMNAWTILQGHGGANWYLQASWAGSVWPNAAEIIRATYPGWSQEDIARFSAMLSRAYLPELHNRMAYGNRKLSSINAMVAIGVFNNDRAAFYEGICNWVSYVPCWIYLKEDGAVPFLPDYWKHSPSDEELAALSGDLFPDPSEAWFSKEVKVIGDDHTSLERGDISQLWNGAPVFVDGLCAETFRDMAHCDLGFASLIYTAEIAWHQGIDLYAIHAKRIMAFMEFQSGLRMDEDLPHVYYRVQFNSVNPTWEAAYNHFHNRMGHELPKTKAFIDKAIRPNLTKEFSVPSTPLFIYPEPGIRADKIMWPCTLQMAWETLTHGELGGARSPELPAGNP